MNNFQELLYFDSQEYEDKVKKLIIDRYPEVIFEDASDSVHPYRSEVKLSEDKEDDFRAFSIKQGFCRNGLVFEMILGEPTIKNKEKIERWIELSKELN